MDFREISLLPQTYNSFSFLHIDSFTNQQYEGLPWNKN